MIIHIKRMKTSRININILKKEMNIKSIQTILKVIRI